jgi:PTS system nitrogen regulatory IIA component
MTIAAILTPSRTYCAVTGSSKKRVLERISQLISEDIPALEYSTLFKNLIAREKLGSTAIGEGIAIPHCRMSMCDEVTGALIRLQEAVDFEAADDKPVDLLFVLLVPEQACDEHLQALAELAGLFNREDFRTALREAGDSQQMYEAAISFALGAGSSSLGHAV